MPNGCMKTSWRSTLNGDFRDPTPFSRSSGTKGGGTVTSDDLILMGTAGIIGLVVVVALFGYFAVNVVILEAHAVVTGDYAFVILSFAALLGAGAAYWATGLWLQKTGRI